MTVFRCISLLLVMFIISSVVSQKVDAKIIGTEGTTFTLPTHITTKNVPSSQTTLKTSQKLNNQGVLQASQCGPSDIYYFVLNGSTAKLGSVTAYTCISEYKDPRLGWGIEAVAYVTKHEIAPDVLSYCSVYLNLNYAMKVSMGGILGQPGGDCSSSSFDDQPQRFKVFIARKPQGTGFLGIGNVGRQFNPHLSILFGADANHTRVLTINTPIEQGGYSPSMIMK